MASINNKNNKKKRSAPSTSKDIVSSKRKASKIDQKNAADDTIITKLDQTQPIVFPSYKRMFDNYTTESPGFIVCVIDTFVNPTPPQLDSKLGSREGFAENHQYFTHLLDGSITKFFADHTKQVCSIRFKLAAKTGLELKLIFGPTASNKQKEKEGKVWYRPVTLCEAVLWSEAFFSVHVDDRYSKIINQGIRDFDECQFQKRMERDIQAGTLPRLWRHDIPETVYHPETERGQLLLSYILTGFCELNDGHFIIESNNDY